MAETYFYIATSNDLVHTSGKYFDHKSKIITSSKYSLNPENMNKLMDLTYKYLPLK